MSFVYSVIIPLKNEEKNITPLVNELEPIMNQLGKPWELICINDGSQDNTQEVLENLAQSKPYLRIVTFDRNYGQSSAFDAGFRNAKGEFIITLDGDRQNDPADIPLLTKAIDTFDLVCGIRKKRKDTFSKRLISFCANSIRQWVCQDGISDTGCSLKIYRRSCFEKIKLYHGMHRFLPALFVIEGFRVHELPVNHRERTQGKSNYHFFNRSLNTVADLFAVAWMRKRRLNYRISSSSSSLEKE